MEVFFKVRAGTWLDTLVVNDFDAGAMENWVHRTFIAFSSSGDIDHNFPQGSIPGRTTTLLLDPNLADMHAKKVVASTQSHEVAHRLSLVAHRLPTPTPTCMHQRDL